VGKPFDLESLASVLLQQVAQVRPQAVPRSAPPVAAAATDPQPTQVPPPVWPALPGIDLAMAQRQSRQDLGRFRRYLDQFLQQFIALREASPPLDNNDERERLIAQCHKLAGSAGIVGAQALADLARSAEQAGRSGDWPRMTADLERIGRALSDLAESGRTLDEHTTDA
jgi:HPt (histidine-containing phosphotransfer) domain-containing protein